MSGSAFLAERTREGAMDDDEDIELLRERVKRLEWEVRWWRRLGAAVLAAAMLIGLVAATAAIVRAA
jgi:hypothetical protein